jgi:hypothetical protein
MKAHAYWKAACALQADVNANPTQAQPNWLETRPARCLTLGFSQTRAPREPHSIVANGRAHSIVANG